MSDPPVSDAWPALEAVYAELPDVPCVGCGLCCVTPQMTFIEFVRLAEAMLDRWPETNLIRMVSEDLAPVERYAGNFTCRVQTGRGKCALHEHRPLACRLEGLPAMDRIGIRKEIICPYITDEQMETVVTGDDIARWVKEVIDLNRPYHTVYDEPYFLTGLGAECWFAVAFDPDIDQPLFLDIRARLREALDMEHLEKNYRDTTGLAAQLKDIDRFFEEAAEKRPARALKTVRRVLEGYPRTGGYFREEAKEYLRLMKRLARGS